MIYGNLNMSKKALFQLNLYTILMTIQ